MKQSVILILTCFFTFGMAVYAQTPSTSQWNSTSSMMQSGSTYSSSISPVGAENITYTSSSGSPSGIGGRRNIDDGFITPGETNVDAESPVGEPYILLLFAIASGIVIRLRHRKA